MNLDPIGELTPEMIEGISQLICNILLRIPALNEYIMGLVKYLVPLMCQFLYQGFTILNTYLGKCSVNHSIHLREECSLPLSECGDQFLKLFRNAWREDLHHWEWRLEVQHYLHEVGIGKLKSVKRVNCGNYGPVEYHGLQVLKLSVLLEIHVDHRAAEEYKDSVDIN